MKRTELKRKTRLQAKAWGVKPRSKASKRRAAVRAARRFTRQFHSLAFVLFGKQQRCRSCGAWASEACPNENSHAEKRARSTWRRIFIQCARCHGEYEDGPARFLARRSLTKADVERWIREHHRAVHEAGIITDTEYEQCEAEWQRIAA